jgi:hypothetical protein
MVLNLPLDECIDNTHIVTREKRKEKKWIKETPTSDRKPRKGKEQDHLKKTSLGPLRQGQRLDTSQTKLCSSKERKPPNQSSKTTKSSPWTNPTPLGRMHANHFANRAAALALLWPVRPVDKIAQQLGTTSARPVHPTGQTGATWETTRSQKKLETTWKPSKCTQQAKSCSNFSPLLAMHESSQKMQKMQPRASQKDKIQHRCYTCPNEQVRYSIAS